MYLDCQSCARRTHDSAHTTVTFKDLGADFLVEMSYAGALCGRYLGPVALSGSEIPTASVARPSAASARIALRQRRSRRGLYSWAKCTPLTVVSVRFGQERMRSRMRPWTMEPGSALTNSLGADDPGPRRRSVPVGRFRYSPAECWSPTCATSSTCPRTRPVPHVAWHSTWATLSGRPLIERPFVVTPKGTRLARLIDAVREIL